MGYPISCKTSIKIKSTNVTLKTFIRLRHGRHNHPNDNADGVVAADDDDTVDLRGVIVNGVVGADDGDNDDKGDVFVVEFAIVVCMVS